MSNRLSFASSALLLLRTPSSTSLAEKGQPPQAEPEPLQHRSARAHCGEMNVVREISRINQTELDIAINNPSASWHEQYKDSAYIFIGGLPYDLTEGDVIAIFSQYGEVVDVNLPRANPNPDKNSGGSRDGGAANGASSSQPKPVGKGKHRGFGFLMYEDQRSTVLAVDNLNGAQVLGRTLRVDHVASYKQPKVTDEEGNRIDADTKSFNAAPSELELSSAGAGAAVADADDDEQGGLEDPMASYFQRLRREGKSTADSASLERDEKRRRKEERARIRAKREERRARASESTPHSRRYAHSPEPRRRGDEREHKRHRSHRDRRENSEEEGVNRYEQMKKRSVLDLDESDRAAEGRHGGSRRRSRTPPSRSSNREDRGGREENDRREDRHRDRHFSSSHYRSSRGDDARRQSNSPRDRA